MRFCIAGRCLWRLIVAGTVHGADLLPVESILKRLIKVAVGNINKRYHIQQILFSITIIWVNIKIIVREFIGEKCIS